MVRSAVPRLPGPGRARWRLRCLPASWHWVRASLLPPSGRVTSLFAPEGQRSWRTPSGREPQARERKVRPRNSPHRFRADLHPALRSAQALAQRCSQDVAPPGHAQRESKSWLLPRQAATAAWLRAWPQQTRQVLPDAEPRLQTVWPELLVLRVELVWRRGAWQVLLPAQMQFQLQLKPPVRQPPVWAVHPCVGGRAPRAAFPWTAQC